MVFWFFIGNLLGLDVLKPDPYWKFILEGLKMAKWLQPWLDENLAEMEKYLLPWSGENLGVRLSPEDLVKIPPENIVEIV